MAVIAECGGQRNTSVTSKIKQYKLPHLNTRKGKENNQNKNKNRASEPVEALKKGLTFINQCLRLETKEGRTERVFKEIIAKNVLMNQNTNI